jgi:hypothetical protein
MYTNEQSKYNEAAFHAFKVRLMDRISEEEYNEFIHELHCEEWYNECSRAVEILMDKDDIKLMMYGDADMDYVGKLMMYGDADMDYVGSLYDLNQAILTKSIQL